MSKRMQVLVDEAEFKKMKQIARTRGLTVAAWVREVLGEACQQRSLTDPERKLAALKRALGHSFPTADPDQMNDEIARGYREGLP